MVLKVLVFSDSHGRTLAMYDIIERERPDAVIHLGDCVEDARELMRAYPGMTLWHVRGNNDYEPDVPLSAVVAPGGVPLYLTHGHKERVTWTSLGVLPRRAREAGCRVALFGHTHRGLCKEAEGVLLINPGSISLPRGGPAGYARLTASAGALREAAVLDEAGRPYRPDKRMTGWI